MRKLVFLSVLLIAAFIYAATPSESVFFPFSWAYTADSARIVIYYLDGSVYDSSITVRTNISQYDTTIALPVDTTYHVRCRVWAPGSDSSGSEQIKVDMSRNTRTLLSLLAGTKTFTSYNPDVDTVWFGHIRLRCIKIVNKQ